ncbi:hypothetical protein EB796_016964 [Bugula neritina]|uniref:Uncharacterized protein n=1 Tax=Bugula neritina TaxID=10212 RepID=A0A7J7JET5_BUGNE|nr:hypothetical protein EB796_016964 [Bugula neritina]
MWDDGTICFIGQSPITSIQRYSCEGLSTTPTSLTYRLHKHVCDLSSFYGNNSKEFPSLHSTMLRIMNTIEPGSAKECDNISYMMQELSRYKTLETYSEHLVGLQIEIACLQRSCGYQSGSTVDLHVLDHASNELYAI